MLLRAYILHLVRATARRDNAQQLREACGVPGGLWPAVDGANMSSTDLSDVVGAQLFEPEYPFTLKTGEIGCFLSHRQIWADLQMRDEDAALIIEDDAALDPDIFPRALELASSNISALGYIQFQTRTAEGPAALVDTNGPCQLTVPQLGGLRTTAQMVSREAAAHLLHLSEIIDRPVDTFVQSHWHTLLRPARIFPSGVSDIADQLDGSTIQSGKKPLLEKIGREFSRGRYRRAVTRLSAQSNAPLKGGLDHG
ncbi:glycosyltransferase family 25 protein [Roseovarius faecimaris]|uniref:Glycosyltransferase family 25 protein n=1 Tax=Roseovarius faecimaris TaxID=2494550 RepID=A0A6I6ITJ7_9RHOB|nr:glycosyltransferase family 25 protein [Roseovarius faecimaris]QGX99522.1 glycosyltransferase family 25 protein [Roseovarius faecimaris]